ncbi:hypothetical protein [Kitasatospora sp. NPDC088346]|uniref:hypothetical protein n=1 Tax=Kitasatospora sp. NPDC088346 TaxID=3364073 RepID=UPI0037FEF623
MAHQLRAQYGPQGPSGAVAKWHVVRTGEPDMAMCGAPIDEGAESKPESAWGSGLRICQQCGSLYLHEVPFHGAEHG